MQCQGRTIHRFYNNVVNYVCVNCDNNFVSVDEVESDITSRARQFNFPSLEDERNHQNLVDKLIIKMAS